MNCQPLIIAACLMACTSAMAAKGESKMPMLKWAGKEKVVNHHNDVPFRVLERKWGWGKCCQCENVASTNTNSQLGIGNIGIGNTSTFSHSHNENMIIHGDNLAALKALLPQYEGKVKCIYIDPPYNTGNEGWVYNDNVNDPQIKKWLGEVVGKEGEDFSRHDKWLCMMYPRLRLLQKLLAEDGVLIISIGFQELANLWLICNEMFSTKQITLITVQTSGGKPSGGFNHQSEYMVFIAPKKFTPNPLPGDTGLSPYHGMNLATFNQEQRPNQVYPIFINAKGQMVRIGKSLKQLVKDGEYSGALKDFSFDYENVPEGESVVWPVSDKGFPCVWRLQPSRFESDYAKGYIRIIPTRKKNNKNKFSIQYLSEGIIKKIENGELRVYHPSNIVPTLEIENFTSSGTTIDTILTDKAYYTAKGKEEMIAIFGNKEIFSYPKPVALLHDVVSRVLGDNDIVLDSFAGSGTTAHAVLKMNKEDGGNRKFILVELMDYAETVTAERVKRVISGYGEGEKAVEGTGGGFGYYELGEPLMIGENLNEDLPVEKIREYVWYMETRETGNVANVEMLPMANANSQFENGNIGIGNIGNIKNDPYLLGVADGTAYYFCYEKGKAVKLNRALLRKLKTKAERYVIYADICLLDDSELEKYNITFKKIPRDIARL